MIRPEAAVAAGAGRGGAAGAAGEPGAVPSTDMRPAGGAAGRFSIVSGAMLGTAVDACRGFFFGARKGMTRRADFAGAGGRRDGGSVSGRGAWGGGGEGVVALWPGLRKRVVSTTGGLPGTSTVNRTATSPDCLS